MTQCDTCWRIGPRTAVMRVQRVGCAPASLRLCEGCYEDLVRWMDRRRQRGAVAREREGRKG